MPFRGLPKILLSTFIGMPFAWPCAVVDMNGLRGLHLNEGMREFN
jgi:hypothetical protein